MFHWYDDYDYKKCQYHHNNHIMYVLFSIGDYYHDDDVDDELIIETLC